MNTFGHICIGILNIFIIFIYVMAYIDFKESGPLK